MAHGKRKRFLSVALCLLMVVGLLTPLSTKRAEAYTYNVTIPKNGRQTKSLSCDAHTINITLTDAYTGLTINKDAWFSYTKSGSKYVVTVPANTSTSSRSGSIHFRDPRTGYNATWELKITQDGKPKPTNTPTPTKKPNTPTPTKKPPTPTKKPATPTPTKKPNTPTPTKKPNTPTPTPKMTASVTTLTFGSGVETKSVTITNQRGTLRADRNTDAMWLTATVNGSSVTFTTTKNTGGARTGTVDITDTGSGQTVRITVKQSAAPTPTPTKKPNTPTPTPKMTASATTLTFGSGVETKSVTITNQRGTLRADRNTDAMWLTATVNGSSVTFTTTKNTGGARTGTVDITDTGSGQTVRITVKQGAAPTPTPTKKPNTPTPTKKPNTPTPTPKMTASATTLTFGSGVETKSVTVTNQKGTLRADRNTDAMWLTATVNGSSVTFTTTQNTGGARTGTVDITDTGSGQTVRITVKQSAAPTPTPTPKMTANITSGSIDGNGGNLVVTITNNRGALRVDRNTDSMWMSASVNGSTVTINASRNPGAARSGSIDITDTGSGQTIRIAVTQGVAPTPTPTKKPNTPTPTPKMTANITSGSIDGNGGNLVVTITNNRGALRADRNTDSMWMSATVNGSTVTINASRNPGAARSGAIDITDTGSGQTIRIAVKQGAAPTPTPTPKLTVNSTSVHIDGNGGSTTVTVTGGQRGTLRVDRLSDAMWLTTSANGASVTFTATENPGTVRTGTVDITDMGSGQTVRITVTQGFASSLPKLVANLTTVSLHGNGDKQNIWIVDGQRGTLRADRNMDAMWLTATVNGSSITFEASSNPGAARTGHVDITDTTTGQSIRITVYQGVFKAPITIVCDQNYKNAPAWGSLLVVYEGNAYGNLPVPPSRGEGFEFAGWYTKSDGGTQITANTIYSDLNQSTIYAHWNINVQFSDYVYLDVDPPVVTAQEGCLFTIPQDVLKDLEAAGEKVIGWSTSMNSGVPDNGTREQYRIPKNLSRDDVSPNVDGVYCISLWAIASGGQSLLDKVGDRLKALYQSAKDKAKKAGEDALRVLLAIEILKHTDLKDLAETLWIDVFNISPQGLIKLLTKYLSESYDPSKNYAYNEGIVKKYPNEFKGAIVSGQGTGQKANLKVGQSTLKDSGCGIIACYNAAYECNKGPYMPDMISKFEKNGLIMCVPSKGALLVAEGILAIAITIWPDNENLKDFLKLYRKGGAGVDPYSLGTALSWYGIGYKSYSVSQIKDFTAVIKDAVDNNKRMKFIVSYRWVYNGVGAHYIYFVTEQKTDPKTGKKTEISVYNSYNTITSTDDMTLDEFINSTLYDKGKATMITGFVIE